jgi:hypothetical protein
MWSAGDVPLRALRPLSAGIVGDRLDDYALCHLVVRRLYFPLTTKADEIVLAGVLAFSSGESAPSWLPLWKGEHWPRLRQHGVSRSTDG